MASLINYVTFIGSGPQTSPQTDMIGVNLLVAAFPSWEDPAGFSDSLNNTWTLAVQEYYSGSGDNYSSIYYCLNPTVSSTQTFSYTSAASYAGATVYGFSGASSSGLDQTATAAGYISNPISTSIAPMQSSEILVSVYSCHSNGNGTLANPKGGLTFVTLNSLGEDTNINGGTGYLLNAASGSQTIEWEYTTINSSVSMAVASFFTVSSPKGNMLLMGMG